MKIKHQLSIATLVMAGVFVTGCSQQSAGGSQVAGGSQSQIEGGSQVAGASQQQVEAPVVMAAKPEPVAQAPAPRAMPKPVRRQPTRRVVRRTNPWLHYHPEAPKCAKTRKHVHKYKKTGARHHHRYACVKPRMARRVATQAKPQVDVRALQMKLKAKGYYKGPIDGVVGSGTRSALKRFMNR